MSIIQLLLSNFFAGGGVAAQGDPYWQYTTLLSGTGSTNGAQNNTFLDSSTNNFTITRNGNTTQGTFTPFSEPNGYWGNYFDGTGDYLSFTKQTTTSSFTCECWFYRGEDPSGYHIIFSGDDLGSVNANNVQFLVTNTGGVQMVIGGTAVITASGSPVAKNQWNHIALVRSGSSCAIFVNGIRTGTGTSSAALNVVSVGTYLSGYQPIGYISNARITTTAVYDPSLTTCTVPTAPLTAVTGTYLLTCQSNRFVDNSASPLTITVNGNPAVVPFAPFGNTTAYSASSVGGSGYFDGNGDYLSPAVGEAFNFGTSAFTIECWAYFNSTATGVTVFGNGTSGGNTLAGVILYFNPSGTLKVFGPSVSGSVSASGITTGQWYHLAVTRSSNTFTLYVNGVSQGTFTDTGSIDGTDSSSPFRIGSLGLYTTYVMNGYISGFRVVKGTALSISVPTAPPTAISGTSLLCNFTNAGIYDQAAKNDMETAGNAQVSTSVIKYGTGSMYFDGTGDYLLLPDDTETKTNVFFGSGEMTIEAWIYPTNVSTGVPAIVDYRPSSGFGTPAFSFWIMSGALSFYAGAYSGGAPVVEGGTISINTWTHVAVSRAGGVTKLFINGNQVASSTNAWNQTYGSTERLGIGATTVGTGNYFYGYISDLRITKGLARYPYNFTPPTRAFGAFFQAAATPTADPYFDYTTLLLPGTGTNGAQNNTFLDSSTNAFSITRNGNTTQGTFSPFSQTGWSNYFNGSSTVGVAYNAAFQPNTYVSLECWVNFSSLASDQLIIGREGMWLNYSYTAIGTASTKIGFSIYNNSGAWITASSISTPVIGQWYHIVGIRDNTTLRIYINGIQEATASFSGTPNTHTSAFAIGGSFTNSNNITGYVSNSRYCNGSTSNTLPYTGTSFTVPTSPLTVSTNTILLTCQSNRFVDNSTSPYTITTSGSPSVQAFSPFAPTAAYSAATNGGSGYFDGTGDFLQSGTDITLSGNFTVEAWIWTATANQKPEIWVNGGQVGQFVVSTNFNAADAGVIFGATSPPGSGWSVGLAGSTALTPNAWNHVAWVRSSSTITVYLNGASGGTLSNSSNSLAMSKVGAWDASTYDFAGYISSLRVSSVARTITVPTAPYTNEANTTLLLNFTNAGITDATAKNDLETVGNAQISTTQSKFGGSSMYFDGTGDYLKSSTGLSSLYQFGTGDFTIEMWFYCTNLSGGLSTTMQLVDFRNATTTEDRPTLGITGSTVYYYSGGAIRCQSGTILVNTWYHVAVVRYSGSTKLYLNGVNVGSTYSDTTNYLASSPTIGNYIADLRYDYAGYIDDLRITKGIARYTANFTAPTAAFPLL